MNKIILISTIFLLSFQIAFGQNKKSEKILDCSHFVYHTHGIKFSAKPEYPKAAQSVRASGKVSVRVLFDESGNVTEAKAISGHPLLHTSSIKAARETKFYPVKIGGKAVRCSFILDYNYFDEIDVRQEIPFVSDLKPKVISMPKPVFPYGGINVSGTISVIVTIDEQGNVINAEAVSGHPLLRTSAEKAAMKAKFEPVTLSGKPMKIRFPIVYDFKREEIPQLKSSLLGKAIKLRKPIFPKGCRCEFSKNYKTVVQFTVNEKGFVESAKGISGHPVLRAASEQAIRNSKFSPSLFDEVPIKASGIIVYDFVLRKKNWRPFIVRYELKLKYDN